MTNLTKKITKDEFKILLFYPPKHDTNKYGKYIFEPTSVGYSFAVMGAFLKKHGFTNIKIYELFGYESKEIEKILVKEKPNLVGISALTEGRKAVFDLVELVKRVDEDIKVILGGPHATHLGKQIIENYEMVDFCVIGEGEITFLELIEAIYEGKKDYSQIKGLMYKQKGNFIQTERRPFIENLDSLPLPDYGLYANIHTYDQYVKNGLEFIIVSSRGCPFKCRFCSSTAFWGNKWRYRSSEEVIKEIEYVYYNFNAKNIDFVDDAFTVRRERIQEICNEIIKRKLKFTWKCTTRADCLDFELMKLMKQAGCTGISIGVESASKIIQKEINKQLNLEKVEDVTRFGKKLKIRIAYLLMVGNINESKETIKETIEFVKRNKPDDVGSAILMIFPDTEVYNFLKSKNLIDDSYWLTEFPAPFCDYDLTYWELRKAIDQINSHNNYFNFNPVMSFIRTVIERFLGLRISMQNKRITPYFNCHPITIRNWKTYLKK